MIHNNFISGFSTQSKGLWCTMDLTPFSINPARTRPAEEPVANPDVTKRHKARDSWDSVPVRVTHPGSAAVSVAGAERKRRKIRDPSDRVQERGDPPVDIRVRGSTPFVMYKGIQQQKNGKWIYRRNRDGERKQKSGFNTCEDAVQACDDATRSEYGFMNGVNYLHRPTLHEARSGIRISKTAKTFYGRYMACMTTPFLRFGSITAAADFCGIKTQCHIGSVLRGERLHVEGWEFVSDISDARYDAPWKRERVPKLPDDVRVIAASCLRFDIGAHEDPEQWYQVTARMLDDYSLATKTIGTRMGIIRHYFPEDATRLKVYKFPMKPNGFWGRVEERRKVACKLRCLYQLDSNWKNIYNCTLAGLQHDLEKLGGRSLLAWYYSRQVRFHDMLREMFADIYERADKNKFISWYHEQQAYVACSEHCQFEVIGRESSIRVVFTESERQIVGRHSAVLFTDFTLVHLPSGMRVILEVDGEQHWSTVNWDGDDTTKVAQRRCRDMAKQRHCISQGDAFARISFRYRSNGKEAVHHLLQIIHEHLSGASDKTWFCLPGDEKHYEHLNFFSALKGSCEVVA
jgi:hypothetical protein